MKKPDYESKTQQAEGEEEEVKEKRTKNNMAKNDHVGSSSSAHRDLSDEAWTGFIEGDGATVSGRMIALCCSSLRGKHCVFRTRSKHAIAIVNSEHCKWCKEACPVSERNGDGDDDEVRIRVYLHTHTLPNLPNK